MPLSKPGSVDQTPTSSPGNHSASGQNAEPGFWKGYKIAANRGVHKQLPCADSAADSGIDSPASEKSISPLTGPSSKEPGSDKVFKYSEQPPVALDLSSLLNSLEDLDFSDSLGKGAHAFVYKVMIQDEGQNENVLALKVPHKTVSLDNEERIMKSMKPHPNVVKCYGKTKVGGKEGLLYECITGPGLKELTSKLAEAQVPVGDFINALKFLEYQKLSAVAHVGDSSVVHSDLKDDNFLFDTTSGTVKLIDFGQAAFLGEKYNAGHVDYAPPETLKTFGYRQFGPNSGIVMDSYPMGQMLYQAINRAADGRGDPYFLGLKFDSVPNEADRKIFSVAHKRDSDIKSGDLPQAFSTNTKDIKARALQTEQYRLASADEDQVQASAEKLEPELLRISMLVNDLMHIDPEKRITAKEAMQHEWFQVNPVDRDRALKTLEGLIV